MFAKMGRWVAGRVQGSKGVQKYDNFMASNPLLKGALDIGSSAVMNMVPGGGIASMAGLTPGGRYAPTRAGATTQGGGYDEMADLTRRRRAAMDALEEDFNNPRIEGLNPGEDPAAGIQYNRPTVGPRDTSLFDRATNMTRPDGTIANDAFDELRGRGEFTYRDRPPEMMTDDPMAEIRNFRSGQGDLAAQWATGGYTGGGGTAFSAAAAPEISRDGIDERASVDELMAFDAASAFERYSEGAQMKMRSALDSANKRLTNSAAGRGRLNTGFFDLDSGELGRQISGDYRADLLSKALETTQLNLSAKEKATGIRATDLAAVRALKAEVAMKQAELGLDASTVNANLSAQNSRAAADRDANFRISAAGLMGNAEDRRLASLETARGMMERDRTRVDKNYESDRDFARTTDQDYRAQLDTIGRIQRDDRARNDKNYESDRGFLLDADKLRQGNYDSDRDYGLAAWETENRTRLAGGELARSDRDFRQGARDNARDRYLDWLAGNSDRAQGAENARRAEAAGRANSNNDLWGRLLGTAGSLAGDYLTRRSTRNAGTTSGSRANTNPQGNQTTGRVSSSFTPRADDPRVTYTPPDPGPGGAHERVWRNY